MKTLVRTTVAALVALGCTMSANTYAGAVVYKDNWDAGLICTPPGPVVNCFRNTGSWHQVQTPSGNTNYSLKGTSMFLVTYYNPNGTVASSQQTTVDSSDKMQFKAGELHNSHSFSQTEFVSVLNGVCQSNTFEYDYHFVNGSVLLDNTTFSVTAC